MSDKNNDAGSNVGKQDGETYLEWRDRVINRISPSFCGAKWGNATIWLESGKTASCHHPLAHKIPLHELQRSYKALHNTEHKKAARRDMLNGIRTPECEACWAVERQGPHLVSDRIFKSIIHPEEQLIVWAGSSRDTADVTPRTLEISFSRLCNMACHYCSQDYSTTWATDLHKHGTYTNLSTPGHQVFTEILPANEGLQPSGNNPYLEAFWKWWEDELADNLVELRVTGGEATMAPDFWRLLDWYRDNPNRGPKLVVNSNMVMAPHLLTRLIDRSKSIRHFEVYTSSEAIGEQGEYIRDGFKYNQWLHNLHALRNNGNVAAIHCMMTLNALSMFTVESFLDFLIRERRALKDKYFLQASLNILRFPAFQSSYSVSYRTRRLIAEDLEHWYHDVGLAPAPKDQTNGTGCWLNEYEKPSIERYIAHLRTKSPDDFEYDRSRKDLVSFLDQFDIRRRPASTATRWRSLFPTLGFDLEEKPS